MPNALQSSLADAAACLQTEAGQSFSFGATAFTAWPVRSPETQVGRLEGASDNVFYFEAVRLDAPTFKRGDKLTTGSSKTTVALVRPSSPTTGLFTFAISQLLDA